MEKPDAKVARITPVARRMGATVRASAVPTRLVKGRLDASRSATTNSVSPKIAPTERIAPTVAAKIPSSTNGNWIEKFEAPTSLMIPISRLLENALNRIVVAINRVALSNITPAIPAAASEPMFKKPKIWSR
jgi:hypothetical protein